MQPEFLPRRRHFSRRSAEIGLTTTGAAGAATQPSSTPPRSLWRITAPTAPNPVLDAERQKQRLDMWCATDDDYVAFELAWMFYQNMIQADGHPKKSQGKRLTDRIINTGRQELAERSGEAGQAGSDVVAPTR